MAMAIALRPVPSRSPASEICRPLIKSISTLTSYNGYILYIASYIACTAQLHV